MNSVRPENRKIFVGIIFILFSVTLAAADGDQDIPEDNYTFVPLLLDGNDNTGAVLGIEFGLNQEWHFDGDQKAEGETDTDFGNIGDGATLEPDHFITRAEIKGTWTTDEDTNPRPYSKANVDLAYSVFRIDKSFEVGGQIAIEGDQAFDNLQSIGAITMGGQYTFTTDSTTYLGGLLAFGEVDASEDDGRKAVTSKTTFNRLEVELHLNIGIEQGNREYSPKAIGLNYRLFEEDNAPSSVKAADLDKFKLVTFSAKFEKGIYIAFSEGELPFDRGSDKVFEIGLTHNLF
jgi:hypothetical protein